MAIYMTRFNPETKQVTEGATETGLNSIDEVVMLYGDPLSRGARTATYREFFFSDYKLHQVIDDKNKVFFNR